MSRPSPTTVDPKALSEFERRMHLEEQAGGGNGPWRLLPDDYQRLGLYRGGRGIYLGLDDSLLPDGVRATIGLLHTGASYDDELSDDLLIYHYPSTRSTGRDASEIEATKAASDLGLPVYVIVGSSNPREIRRGWVADWDDKQAVFLIEFGAQSPPRVRSDIPGDPFGEKRRRQRRSGSTLVRDNRFRFHVLKRYGSRCGACNIADNRLIQAAHIVPVSAGGSDVPANGIPLCPTHHFAFDSPKVPLTIEPETHEWRLVDGSSLGALNISRASIGHFDALPSPAALAWHFKHTVKKAQ